MSVGFRSRRCLQRVLLFMGGGSKQDFDDKVGQAISLAGLLTQTVDHLVTAFFDKHKRAILEERMKR